MKCVLEPMSIARDHQSFRAWWHAEKDRVDMVEALNDLADSIAARSGIEHAMQRVMLEVFQESGPVNWLKLQGLRAGVAVCDLVLDADPSYNTDGELDGLNVVLTGATATPDDECRSGWLTVSAYVDTASLLAPDSFDDLASALAEFLDTALEILNDHTAKQDKFINSVRSLKCS